MIAEWFSLPVYVDDPGAGLPACVASDYQGQLRAVSKSRATRNVTELVFAGTDGNLASVMNAWQGSHQLYVMEDALYALGTPDAQWSMLAPFYDEGVIPRPSSRSTTT